MDVEALLLMRCFIIAMLLLTGVVPVSAQVLCPRVTSEHNADTSDLARFRQYHKWRDKQGEELAIAVWQYLCDKETGLYHMNTVNDGPDPWSEYSTVRDPIKLMNVYNVGYCGIFGPVLDGVFQGIGFQQGRAFGVSKWNHCTTEVWYDDSWHYLDLDVRGALRKADGTVANLDEARSQRDLWVDPPRKISPFFPTDPDKGRVFEIYRDSRIDYFYRWFQAGHTMDFQLRPGETLTRWWRPQGGRWHHLPAYNSGFVRSLLEKEPRGYKSNHADFSVWTQGNGLWQYAPNLTADSSDFINGVDSVSNLAPGKQGLQLLSSGVGEATFSVATPWIIVPQVNNLDDENDDREASLVTLDAASPVTVLISLDHGATWETAATVQVGKSSLDLTSWAKGTYGFLLKLQATGRARQVVLRTMEVDTWVQVAPISLPRLANGLNRCRFDLGDRYGKPTLPMRVTPNVADPEDLAKYVVQIPNDYDLDRKTARIHGDVTLRLEASQGKLIDWLSAGACFSTHQNQAAEKTDNRIAFAVGKPEGFQEIYKADVPTWVNHWRYQWDQDVLLDQPARVVFLRYTGAPGLNALRATAHLTPRSTPETAIEITHAYQIGDRVIEKVISLQKPGQYEIQVDGDPENLFVRMAVPSQGR